MTIIVSDNFNTLAAGADIFNRAPQVAPASVTWKRRSGQTFVGAPGGGSATPGGDGFAATIDTGISDLDIRVDVSFVTSVSRFAVGAALQSEFGVADFSRYVVWNTDSGNVRLSRFNAAGTRTDITTVSAGLTLTTGATYAMRLVLNGSTITFSINGTSVISLTDTNVAVRTHASIGGLQIGANFGDVRYDNFVVEDVVVAPIITGPTGAAGAASITHSALELQNTAGTWTSTGTGTWSLSGTDAGLLSISAGGVVTLASGNFDFETKASYSFNVVRGSASQAVTLNITNVVEVSAPTKSTPTATSAVVGFTTDIGSGEARAVLIAATSPPTAPSAAQVKAGQNAAGTTVGVVAPAALTITSAGVKTFASAAVTSGLTYYGFIVHTASGVDSAVLSTGPMYPGTGRPAADVGAAGGWTASSGTDLFAMLDEDTPSDTDFITSPELTASWQTKDFDLDKPYPAGTYANLRIRCRVPGATGLARVRLLDASGNSLAVSADHAVTGDWTTFTTATVTIAATATRFRVEGRSA